jgi:hypothetical protein
MSWNRLPGSQRLLVHAGSGRSARVIRSLSGTSDWRRGMLDRAGTAALTVAGARPLPTATLPEWPPIGWDRLDDQLRAALPGIRLLGAVAPRQRGRARLSMLGRMTGNLVVVKLGRPDDGLGREGAALQLLSRDPLPGIATPEPLAAGTIRADESVIEFLVTTSVALHKQRAAIDEPLRSFESDLASRLAGLPTGPDHHEGLVPVHGDLTPWNLRRTPRGLALFDWEAAGWGDPSSDLVHYRSTCDEVRRPWNTRKAAQ